MATVGFKGLSSGSAPTCKTILFYKHQF